MHGRMTELRDVSASSGSMSPEACGEERGTSVAIYHRRHDPTVAPPHDRQRRQLCARPRTHRRSPPPPRSMACCRVRFRSFRGPTGGTSISRRRRSIRLGELTSRSSEPTRRAAPRLRRRGLAGQRRDLRVPVRRRRRHTAEEGRGVPLLGRKRRREPHDRIRASRSIRSRTRRSRRRTGSKAASPATSICAAAATATC